MSTAARTGHPVLRAIMFHVTIARIRGWYRHHRVLGHSRRMGHWRRMGRSSALRHSGGMGRSGLGHLRRLGTWGWGHHLRHGHSSRQGHRRRHGHFWRRAFALYNRIVLGGVHRRHRRFVRVISRNIYGVGIVNVRFGRNLQNGTRHPDQAQYHIQCPNTKHQRFHLPRQRRPSEVQNEADDVTDHEGDVEQRNVEYAQGGIRFP